MIFACIARIRRASKPRIRMIGIGPRINRIVNQLHLGQVGGDVECLFLVVVTVRIGWGFIGIELAHQRLLVFQHCGKEVKVRGGGERKMV